MTLQATTAAALADHGARFGRHGDVILLGGSSVVGLGQGSSDYDIYIVHLDDADEVWSELPAITAGAGVDAPVEVERFSASSLSSQAERLRAALAGGDGELRGVGQEVLVRYSALLTAHPLRDPTGVWPQLLRDLDGALFAEACAQWHRAWCDELRRLARFFVRVGDTEAADASCRAAVAHAFDAVLVSCGELYFSPKYRFEKAARRPAAYALVDQAWPFSAPLPTQSTQAIGDRLAAVEQFARLCGGRTVGRSVTAPRRHPDATVRHVGTEQLIVLGTRCWPVDESLIALWPSLERPVPWDALHRAHPDLDEDELALHLRWLAERCLLDTPVKLGRWAMWI
jgi:hypothetical protein